MASLTIDGHWCIEKLTQGHYLGENSGAAKARFWFVILYGDWKVATNYRPEKIGEPRVATMNSVLRYLEWSQQRIKHYEFYTKTSVYWLYLWHKPGDLTYRKTGRAAALSPPCVFAIITRASFYPLIYTPHCIYNHRFKIAKYAASFILSLSRLLLINVGVHTGLT